LLRETKGEVVLVSRLRAALERLNPALPPEAITAAVDELTRDRSAMNLEAANREVYLLLKEGIRVSVAERDSTPGRTSSGLRPPSPQLGEGKGGQETLCVRVIDWEHPANNDFLLVSQFSVTGALGSLIEKRREVLRRVISADRVARPERDRAVDEGRPGHRAAPEADERIATPIG
jgi:type I site-specific restriction-modification system R (restriction) subunit